MSAVGISGVTECISISRRSHRKTNINIHRPRRMPCRDRAGTRTENELNECNCYFPAPSRNYMTQSQALQDCPGTSQVSFHKTNLFFL
jgi:hypothetical protein